MLKAGILVDGHGNLKYTRKLVSRYNKEKVDCILLNGDFATDDNQLKSMRSVLKAMQKSKSPVYVIPGSHENSKAYKKALREAKKPIVDCMNKRNRKITIKGYDLMFLPGSDVLPACGSYLLTKNKKGVKETKKRWKQKGYAAGNIVPTLISELKVKNPKKTVVVAHVPPKCRRKAIDTAVFGRPYESFMVPGRLPAMLKRYKGRIIEKNKSIIIMPYAKMFIKEGFPIRMTKENVGNEDLAVRLKKQKVKFFVCGHIHEAGQRGVNASSKPVSPGKWSSSLFVNAGSANEGKGSIFMLKNGKAAYKRVNV